ncbi:hypothetical protein [Paraburkholderia tropica]|uniref:hypothetical protein n=1 Tax=Paraburkholderia tropica TaxID=92647 RepID=UPI0007ED0F40|nr:hypothetical protein [Paraburkholderia tropica]MBB2982237.1 hypothetical protein [Paraburkholderia tropica]OBR48791.1 hypothetical protein A6456_18135 [Paraburkholderia tropica]
MFEDFIDLAKQIRRSEGFKNALNSPSRLSLHLKQHFNHGYFAIEIRANSGFFSVMQIVLCILLYCEEKNLTPFISARGGSYGDAQGKVDWLAECFENIAHGATPRDSNLRLRTSRVEDLGNLGFRRYESGLQLTHASTVFLSQYRPAPSIRTEVDTTCRRLGIGPSTLGVHFRGTDKKHEAHVIERDAFCRMVEKTLSDHPHLTNIFVSSDEQTFLDFFKNWGFAVPVDIAPATMLANGEKPVHFSGHPGLAIGREALITSLLLSSCGYLIKTPSYLSAWSRIFNPSLPVRLVAPPRANAFWFPDSQIWLEQENHGREQAGLQIDALASNSPFVGTSATS